MLGKLLPGAVRTAGIILTPAVCILIPGPLMRIGFFEVVPPPALADLLRDLLRQPVVGFGVDLRNVGVGMAKHDLCGVQAELRPGPCSRDVP